MGCTNFWLVLLMEGIIWTLLRILVHDFTGDKTVGSSPNTWIHTIEHHWICSVTIHATSGHHIWSLRRGLGPVMITYRGHVLKCANHIDNLFNYFHFNLKILTILLHICPFPLYGFLRTLTCFLIFFFCFSSFLDRSNSVYNHSVL